MDELKGRVNMGQETPSVFVIVMNELADFS